MPDSSGLKKLLEFVKAGVARSFCLDGLIRLGAVSMAGFYAGRQDQLKTIKVPVVVIHGSEDPLVVADAGKEVAANIPGAEFELLKGMGHELPAPLISSIAELIVKNPQKVKTETH